MSDSQCPGIDSESAGKAKACSNCPNKSSCLTNDKEKYTDECNQVKSRLSAVKHKIIVLSGKGGVGKSTFSALLADYLSTDSVVGVVDADICGPSLPKIFGVEGVTAHAEVGGWNPIFVRENLMLISSSLLVGDSDEALILYGDKKSGLILHFLRDVNWPPQLDFLIIDTPPGTSDEHLSSLGYLRDVGIDGAVIITTPHELSLVDVRKQINFCKRGQLGVIGVVENMASFVCPHCAQCSKVFPPNSVGGREMADEMGVKFLGSVPLDAKLARCCDEGRSFLEECEDSPAREAMVDIFRTIADFCED